MPAAVRLSELRQRKQLLLLQADLHRQLLDLERRQLHTQLRAATGRFHAQRWWVIGGTAALGLALSRFGAGGALTRWLPLAATAWKVVQGLRGR